MELTRASPLVCKASLEAVQSVKLAHLSESLAEPHLCRGTRAEAWSLLMCMHSGQVHLGVQKLTVIISVYY